MDISADMHPGYGRFLGVSLQITFQHCCRASASRPHVNPVRAYKEHRDSPEHRAPKASWAFQATLDWLVPQVTRDALGCRVQRASKVHAESWRTGLCCLCPAWIIKGDKISVNQPVNPDKNKLKNNSNKALWRAAGKFYCCFQRWLKSTSNKFERLMFSVTHKSPSLKSAEQKKQPIGKERMQQPTDCWRLQTTDPHQGNWDRTRRKC